MSSAAMMEEEVTGAAPPHRLMITKMTMENFKSYYGVQEVGPFHKVGMSGQTPTGEMPRCGRRYS